MSQSNETKSQLSIIRNKFLLNLAINGLLPYLFYIFLRPRLSSDVSALAIAAAIPAVRTFSLWLWRRRIDWIGMFFVLGFAIVLAISIFLSGNTLLLEIHGMLLTGVIGLVLLISAFLGKPLLLPFFKLYGQNGPGGTNLFDKVTSSPTNQDRIANRISFGREYFPYICAARLAQQIGTSLVEFPGNHSAFAGYPKEFAERLLEVLGT